MRWIKGTDGDLHSSVAIAPCRAENKTASRWAKGYARDSNSRPEPPHLLTPLSSPGAALDEAASPRDGGSGLGGLCGLEEVDHRKTLV